MAHYNAFKSSERASLDAAARVTQNACERREGGKMAGGTSEEVVG